MRLKPIGNRLVLKKFKSVEKTPSGIIMPTSEQEKPDYAEILEISEDLSEKKFRLGDKVIYTKYAGTLFKDGDDELIIIEDKDILAIVEE